MYNKLICVFIHNLFFVFLFHSILVYHQLVLLYKLTPLKLITYEFYTSTLILKKQIIFQIMLIISSLCTNIHGRFEDNFDTNIVSCPLYNDALLTSIQYFAILTLPKMKRKIKRKPLSDSRVSMINQSHPKNSKTHCVKIVIK